MPKIRVLENTPSSEEPVTAIYVRVTHEESLKADLSVPNQKARSLELCGERGWSPAKLYAEPRNVGGDLLPAKRPALAELLRDVEAGRVARVLVRHTDRLWRGSKVQDLILDALRRNSVELWDFAGQREMRSAGGRFALKVLGAAAELEKGLTGERIREMKRGKAKAGKIAGGPPPFGYTSQSRVKLEHLKTGLSEEEAERLAVELCPLSRTLYVDEREAGIVRLMFELYLDRRWGARRIATELNRLGHRRRSGLVWVPVKVGLVINNPVVAGFTSYDEDAYEKGLPSKKPRFRQTLYPATHPAIIPLERWHEAQRLKTEVNAPRARMKSVPQARAYLLSGVLRCGVCGAHMRGKSGGTTRSATYICSRRAYYGPKDGCAGPTILQKWAESTVWSYLDRLFRTPELVAEILEKASRKVQRELPEAKERLAAVRCEAAELEAKQRKWMERFEEADDAATSEILWGRIRELKARQLELRAEEESLVAKLAGVGERRLTPEDVSRALAKLQTVNGAPSEKRRNLIERLVHRHDLRVRVLEGHRLAVSLRLDAVEDEASRAAVGSRLVLIGQETQRKVTGGTNHRAGPMSTGSPVPGGPARSTLCPPATATSIAIRARCWPRTSDMSAAKRRVRAARSWPRNGRNGRAPASAPVTSARCSMP